MVKEDRRKKKQKVEAIAAKFVLMDEIGKAYITGYMTGAEDERAKWERKKAAVVKK